MKIIVKSADNEKHFESPRKDYIGTVVFVILFSSLFFLASTINKNSMLPYSLGIIGFDILLLSGHLLVRKKLDYDLIITKNNIYQKSRCLSLNNAVWTYKFSTIHWAIYSSDPIVKFRLVGPTYTKQIVIHAKDLNSFLEILKELEIVPKQEEN